MATLAQLQDGDPLYLTEGERSTLQNEYLTTRDKFIRETATAIRYKVNQEHWRSPQEIFQEFLDRRGVGFITDENASDANLRKFRVSGNSLENTRRISRLVDDATKQNKKNFADIVRKTLVTNLALAASGGFIGSAGAITSKLASVGINLSPAVVGGVLGAAPVIGGALDLAAAASKSQKDAQEAGDKVKAREADITEQYAKARDLKNAAERYREILNLSKYDSIAKAGRVQVQAPSLPSFKLNVNYRLNLAKAQLSGEGNV